jgi:hypothetical protein
MGPPELTTQDHHQPQDHGAWSPLPVQPLVGPRRQPAQDASAGGLVSTCSFSCSPANRSAPWRWTAPLSARRRGGAAACARAMRRPRSGDPRASHPRPTQHHPFPSSPYAGGRPRRPGPRRHVEPIAPNGDGPLHRAIPGASAVRTTRLQSRGHQRPVRPDTWMAPVAWTPDVRLTDRTDVRTADRERGQGDDRRGRRPDILATGDHPLGGQTSPGSQCLAPLGHP